MDFYGSEPLRDIERLMKEIPNFLPRGHGVMTICRHEYTAKDCECRNCPYHTGRGKKIKCGLEVCAYLKERIEAGAATVREIMEETMSAIRYPPFVARLERYMEESEVMKYMDFRNEKHRTVFEEATIKLDRKNHALMAAVYLLAADRRLWIAAKPYLTRNEIRFDRIKPKNSTVNSYTLYCAAKDLYLGTKKLTIRDLADTELISQKLFRLICNAMAIRRFGLGAIHFSWTGI